MVADARVNAEQVKPVTVAPAPPPPYLSPVSVNVGTANKIGAGSAVLLNTTTQPPDAVIVAVKDPKVSPSMEQERAKAALDCMLSSWGAWSVCATMSGDLMSSREQTRSRQIIQNQQPGGKACGLVSESHVC